MALIGNYSVLCKTPGSWNGGGATGQGMNRASFNKSGDARARYFGEAGFDKKSGVPDGYRAPVAWVIAQSDGGLASRGNISGDGSINAGNLAGGLNAESPLIGSGAITNANLGLIVSGVAALAGSGAFSSAAIAGKLDAIAALAGAGSVTAALGALADALADLSGSGTLSATPYATGDLSADLTPFTELSPQSLAAAVWAAIDAVETGLTPAEALRIIAAATAGKSSGFGTGTVTFRNAEADSKDRIIATVDGAGNRTGITIDKT